MLVRLLTTAAAVVLAIGLWGGNSASAAAQAAPKCDVVGVYGVIAMMVCPNAKSDAELEAAGRGVCGTINVRGVCNAWIWTDSRRAAKVLPMTKRELNSVTALWINKQNTLKVCRRVGCYAGQIK
ncbi:MAG: hypothetical protein ACPGOY_15740 [Rhodospirillaceae bacterium]